MLTCCYLHEEPCQQSLLDVEGVDPGAEGRHGHGQLDPPQGGHQLGAQGIGCLQGGQAEVEVLAPLLHTEV